MNVSKVGADGSGEKKKKELDILAPQKKKKRACEIQRRINERFALTNLFLILHSIRDEFTFGNFNSFCFFMHYKLI